MAHWVILLWLFICLPCNFAAGASHCDFEVDLCQYKQSTTDEFDWTRHSGGTTSFVTGPSFDHTYGNSSGLGHYIYIETSAPRLQGDKASIISPPYPVYPDGQCLLFWTHMYGSTIGTLTASIMAGSKKTDVWTRSGNQGNQWFNVTVAVNITESPNYSLIFEGVRGSSYTGDIALDDINVLQGACPDVDECLPREGRGPCEQLCNNTDGGFVCSCNASYILQQDGLNCKYNVCFPNDGRGPCEHTCVNTDTSGNFTCGCNAGYILNFDGTTCDDIDGCSPSPCVSLASCTDAPPPSTGAICSCQYGYDGDGQKVGTGCTDVDGCSVSPCVSLANCTDVPAPDVGFICTCPDSYEGNGRNDGNGCTAADLSHIPGYLRIPIAAIAGVGVGAAVLLIGLIAVIAAICVVKRAANEVEETAGGRHPGTRAGPTFENRAYDEGSNVNCRPPMTTENNQNVYDLPNAGRNADIEEGAYQSLDSNTRLNNAYQTLGNQAVNNEPIYKNTM